MPRNKAKPTNGYQIGYGRPPAEFRYRKGQSGNPSGEKRQAPSIAADLRVLLEHALNKKVRSGAGAEFITAAAAGIEQLVAQYAAGDRHARRCIKGNRPRQQGLFTTARKSLARDQRAV